MIPFIRSINELMAITQSRSKAIMSSKNKNLDRFSEVNFKKEIHINSIPKKSIGLPELPKVKRRRWVKSKEAVSKFFNELDYNNQIQSSYDLTLLDMQNNFDQHDIA
tara:strand:- start:109 stop:429 length:321 start_codon:yes stop_codon:yes gene_type:complete